MRTAALLLGFSLILVVSLGLGGVMATDHGTEESVTSPVLVYDIAIEPNGDANWEIRAEFPIESEEDEAAFNDLANRFEADEGDTYLPIEPYEATAGELSTILERDMTIEEEARAVNRTDQTGILSVSFTWTQFAVVEDDRVFVGDVFETEEMPWFLGLEAHERLYIHAPANHTVTDSGLPVRDRAMQASGPREFHSGDLRGTFVSSGSSSGFSPLLWIGLALAGLAALIAVLSVALGRGPFARGTSDDIDEVPEEELDQEGPPEDGAGLPDETLLSDEERVLALIEAKDGRMKQADIVTETDWSNAKVSQLLSQMAEEGEIEKLRIGRENLIRLPDDD